MKTFKEYLGEGKNDSYIRGLQYDLIRKKLKTDDFSKDEETYQKYRELLNSKELATEVGNYLAKQFGGKLRSTDSDEYHISLTANSYIKLWKANSYDTNITMSLYVDKLESSDVEKLSKIIKSLKLI